MIYLFYFCIECENYFLFCFFFQAEDGIRDGTVTGVQTCALPIWISCAVEEVAWPMSCASFNPAATRSPGGNWTPAARATAIASLAVAAMTCRECSFCAARP